MELHAVGALGHCQAEVTVGIGLTIILLGRPVRFPVKKSIPVTVLKNPEMDMIGRLSVRLENPAINIGSRQGQILVCFGSSGCKVNRYFLGFSVFCISVNTSRRSCRQEVGIWRQLGK